MKIRTFIIGLFCLLSTSAEGQESLERHWKPGMEKMRVISYNIFNGFDWGKDGDRRERFIHWMKEKDPEVLAMQELCGFTQESLSQLAKQWGHPYAVIVKENGYPVGISSKRPIELKNKIVEGCGHGLLHVETYGYDFLVTHLNPGDTNKRREEAEFIIDYIRKHKLDNFLLMGDMNAHSPIDAEYMESNATELLMKYGGTNSTNLINGKFDYSIISRFLSFPMIDVCRPYVSPDKRTTFPTPILMYQSRHKKVRAKCEERIDFILTPLKVADKVVDAFIWNEGATDYLSDHYPIGVDLVMESPSTTNTSSAGASKKSFADQWQFVGTAIEENGYHVWGSSPIEGRDGKIHLFSTRWQTSASFDPGWRSASEIAHYVSDTPEGPFRFVGVVLAGTGKDTWDKYGIHNPAIHQVGDQYVLLYISNNNYRQPPHPANQKIGMLIADNLNGPWKKVGQDGCILSPSSNPAHWTYKASNGVVNPALLQHPNGGFLLYFKSHNAQMGVAFADNVEGPYVMYPTPVTKNKQAIEDGYAFVYQNQICLLTTDNHGILKKGGGILWRSDDGLNFDQYEPGFNLFEEYVGKRQLRNARQIYGSMPKFERPQVLMQQGKPGYLYVPSGANKEGNSGTAVYVLKFKE
ncbi:endonuclease/exonuclease/phosphatase family protein [Bacteroides sp.]|uniref:endonuclease/exonuclease/phosphatase family protein n=2 Tax=Bacteroides sp. TaxID=29523 RepID=UPI002FC6019E